MTTTEDNNDTAYLTEMLKDVMAGRLTESSGFRHELNELFDDAEEYKKFVLNYASKPYNNMISSYTDFPSLPESSRYNLSFINDYLKFAEDVKYHMHQRSSFNWYPNEYPDELHQDIVIIITKQSLSEHHAGIVWHIANWTDSYLRAKSYCKYRKVQFPEKFECILTPYLFERYAEILMKVFANRSENYDNYYHGYNVFIGKCKYYPELYTLFKSYPAKTE